MRVDYLDKRCGGESGDLLSKLHLGPLLTILSWYNAVVPIRGPVSVHLCTEINLDWLDKR